MRGFLCFNLAIKLFHVMLFISQTIPSVTCARKLGAVGFLAMLHFASVISLLLIVDMQIMAYERRKFVMGLFFYRGFNIIENLINF
jgi:hypothetical protein